MTTVTSALPATGLRVADWVAGGSGWNDCNKADDEARASKYGVRLSNVSGFAFMQYNLMSK